jgi:hypothetical protein
LPKGNLAFITDSGIIGATLCGIINPHGKEDRFAVIKRVRLFSV